MVKGKERRRGKDTIIKRREEEVYRRKDTKKDKE